MDNMTAQSWFDFPVAKTMDPRSIVQNISLVNAAATTIPGIFVRSTTWLKNTTWINPPMTITPGSTGFVIAANPSDFGSQEIANAWNGTHAMTMTSTQLAIAVQKFIFFKAGTGFINNIFLDFLGGASSTDLQFSFRDNSVTSGDFTSSALGTVPVFSFGSTTFSGTAKQLSITFLQPGRYTMAIRVVDNGGNFSLFEMECIVL